MFYNSTVVSGTDILYCYVKMDDKWPIPSTDFLFILEELTHLL